MNLQLVIPVAKKNIRTLNKNLFYIEKFIEPNSICILTNKNNFPYFNSISSIVKLIDEDNVIPNCTYKQLESIISKTNIPLSATGWYLQQFLKFFWSQSELCGDFYTTWDADTFPVRKIHLFSENGKPYIHKKGEYHKPYFETIYKIFGLEKKVDFSFISEKMTFSKKIVLELLHKIDATKIEGNSIVEKVIAIASQSDDYRAFSEFETYGTYITHFYPDFYEYQSLKSLRNGTHYIGLKPNKFDLAFVSFFYSTVSFEAWDSQNKFFIFILKIASFVLYPFYLLLTKNSKLQ